jgi:mono/diheme cytochrome c family protein
MLVRLFVVIALIVVATLTASLAMAQSAARGATYYRSFPASCADCHNADPRTDPHASSASGGVRMGANRPDLVTGAITTPGAYTSGNTDMYALLYPMYLQNTATWDAMIADIAAYLGQVFAAAPPPPPPPPSPPPPPPPPVGTLVAAQEFHHAAFDHYFITTVADEITKLGNGTFAGWSPTGRTFNVYLATGAPAGTARVCRFFSAAFAPKSSHFYTPSASECALVQASADWSFEGEVFNVPPVAADGSCPSGTLPVYRLYNNGMGAAPNHRYTTDATVRAQMIAAGWVPEGSGSQGVVMCTPP